jgi:hypothetical protein
MRVAVGKALRVGPGDEVLIRGQLPSNSRLARLFVFAKESNGQFAPYVANLLAVAVGDTPRMHMPMSLRLDSYRNEKEISFVSDFDGSVQVMQEIDTAKDPRAIVKIKRKINPHLSWKEKLTRRFLAWKP